MKNDRLTKIHQYILMIGIQLLIMYNSCNSLKTKIETKFLNTNTIQSHLLTKTNVKLTTTYCNPLCLECSVNDLNYCTRCGTEGMYYNYGCYKVCPEGSFLARESRECNTCNDKCPVCWGPDMDMCGTIAGVKSYVVKLQDEIEKFFKDKKYSKKEIEDWLEILKSVFNEKKEEFESNLDIEIEDSLSTNQVYNIENDKIIELPIGSHSDLNGVFIPVPTYINNNKELVNSHWIYRKGTWDGKRWVAQYFPRLPSFIKDYAEKNLIYNENGGYWTWDPMKNWFWIKQKNLVDQELTVQDVLNRLNVIKFDV